MTHFVSISCYRCKEEFGMSADSYAVLKRSSATFWCPFGHQQHFVPGKTEAEKLRDELDAERRRRQYAEQDIAFQKDLRVSAERSASAYKGQATRLRNRAKAGVCPCCNRHFVQLERHMASKHPGFTNNPDADLPKGVAPVFPLSEGAKVKVPAHG